MSDRPTPSLHLEQAAVGERPIAAKDADAVASLRVDAERLLADDPPALAAARLRAIAASRTAPRARFAFPVSLAAFAAASFAVFLVVAQPGEQLRAKGTVSPRRGEQPELALFRLVDGRSEPLHDGAVARPGDRVQIAVVRPLAEAVVLSLDGRGNVTLHHPADTKRDPRVTDVLGATGVLPASFELDDAPAFERFVLVSADHLDVDEVLAAATTAASARDPAHVPLALPRGWRQSSLLVAKEAP